MLAGKQSWQFSNRPSIIASAASGGPFEANGKLSADFDILHDDLWMEQNSYEKAHRLLIEETTELVLKKAGKTEEDIQFFLAGDLINQITPTSLAARTNAIPYFGLFGACSTSMEGLALAAFIVNYGGASSALTGASSHNAAVEKQFRYPTEYGGQKPPTAQWTITGAGLGLIGLYEKNRPAIISATIGRVKDMGLKDPFNMGGAMAPAAVDTILAHFRDLNLAYDYYDAVYTGDLGEVGRETAYEMLVQQGCTLDKSRFRDCGLMLFKEDQPVLAGGSGAGCSAAVLYGHLLKEMAKGKMKRILVVATGALLSPLTVQQKESIPAIAHAVAIEWAE